ncbi:MAG: DUF1269 domain-containing protein [Methylococcales bacterium]|nr:DUF1269 domain-containing protein [Methylococcales bacterium]
MIIWWTWKTQSLSLRTPKERSNCTRPASYDYWRVERRVCGAPLIGMLFLNPLLGFAVGASAGAVSGSLTDVGIYDQFMKEPAATMTPNSSSLFVLLRIETSGPDKVLEELKGTGGTILKTSLTKEGEARLQAALDGNLTL